MSEENRSALHFETLRALWSDIRYNRSLSPRLKDFLEASLVDTREPQVDEFIMCLQSPKDAAAVVRFYLKDSKIFSDKYRQ